MSTKEAWRRLVIDPLHRLAEASPETTDPVSLHRDPTGPGGIVLAEVHSVDADAALGGVVEALQQGHAGALATARFAHQRHLAPRAHGPRVAHGGQWAAKARRRGFATVSSNS